MILDNLNKENKVGLYWGRRIIAGAYPQNIIIARLAGLILTKEIKKNIKRASSYNILRYYFCILPVVYMPNFLLKIIYNITCINHFTNINIFIKRIIKKILKKAYILIVPNKVKRKIKKYYLQENLYIHKNYGRIYYPYYNMNVPLNSKYPDIYNKEGKKMEMYFLRDVHGAHLVYSYSKYFLYDRYNFGLDTHIYTHNSMLETMGEPKRKYGMLVEAEIIVPDDYLIFKRNPGLEKEFDLIFTYSDKILQTIPNSRYIPYYLNPWYFKDYMANLSDQLKEKGGVIMDNYKYKTKNISIIASGKESVPLHKYRNAIARQCKTNNLADAYGTFDGGRYCDITEPFLDYRFSIVIENEITPYAFTEKITNCFAAMTIPIYLGASKINEIFNSEGIIQFNMGDDIEEIIKKCTKELYEEKIHAVIDNFNIVNIDKSADDIMYEKYIYADSGKLNPGELIKSLRNQQET